MGHKRTQNQYLDNVHLDGRLLESPLDVTIPSSIFSVGHTLAPVECIEASFSGDILITDTGGTGGGYYAAPILTFPASRIQVVHATVEAAVTAVGPNISSSGACALGSGTGATSVGGLTGTSIDITALALLILAGGAGTQKSQTIAGGAFVDARAGKTWNFNFGVTDTAISGDETVTLSLLARLFYLDVTRGW